MHGCTQIRKRYCKRCFLLSTSYYSSKYCYSQCWIIDPIRNRATSLYFISQDSYTPNWPIERPHTVYPGKGGFPIALASFGWSPVTLNHVWEYLANKKEINYESANINVRKAHESPKLNHVLPAFTPEVSNDAASRVTNFKMLILMVLKGKIGGSDAVFEAFRPPIQIINTF